MSNQIDDIIEAIRNMDTDLVSSLLPGDSICFEVDKGTFLKKLEHLFIQLRLSEVSDFEVLRLDETKCFIYIKPFDFKMVWKFELQERGVLHINNDGTLDEFEKYGNSPFQMYFFEDEKFGFVETPDYKEKKNACAELLRRVEGSITGLAIDFVQTWHNESSFFYYRLKLCFFN